MSLPKFDFPVEPKPNLSIGQIIDKKSTGEALVIRKRDANKYMDFDHRKGLKVEKRAKDWADNPTRETPLAPPLSSIA